MAGAGAGARARARASDRARDRGGPTQSGLIKTLSSDEFTATAIYKEVRALVVRGLNHSICNGMVGMLCSQ